MRINKFIALSTGMSRRAADIAIEKKRVLINGLLPTPGHDVTEQDSVTLDNRPMSPIGLQTILLYKPAGYVTSREGQGSSTIYDLLPSNLRHLKPVGRLDKQTSGLLLLTNDGALAQELTHPRHQKVKVYKATLNKALAPLHRQMISDMGVQLEDGPSKLYLERLNDTSDREWQITMHEGRNRQIRRTFTVMGYEVTKLHRIRFGTYHLPEDLRPGEFQTLSSKNSSGHN